MPILPLLAETPWYAPALFALGCGVFVAVLLRLTWRRLGKIKRSGSGPYLDKQHRPTSEWDGVKKDADARFDRHEVELHELARDLTGQIDSKLILFRELVARSERQIQRLEELLAEAEKQKSE